MDIRALRYFVELINQQSFTKASERLFVTQPTISKMIRNLEQELEQPLLHREGRRFWLTEAGEIVYQRAQQILTQMQQLEAELTDLNQLQRGHLRLGIPPMVGHVYARLFRQYRQTYPNVELTVVEYGGRKIEQAILDGEIDVAVTMLSPNQHPDLNYHSSRSLPHFCCWCQIFPVGVEQNTLRWTQLSQEPFYLFTHEFTLSDHIHTCCQAAGYTPQVAARSSQWDFLVAISQKWSRRVFSTSTTLPKNSR
ncbi:LysR substrate-binding domain-containing protein [Vibrio metoecus]|uniref:LysR family transcriptional regulator n=1 Tax=Vibrio metoecus TaxID=1481663 RepID=UPI000A411CD2|nr:LysR substrate-binding domain-containing protein [Vibrio metoecus]